MNGVFFSLVAAVELPGGPGGDALGMPSRRVFGDAALIIAAAVGVAVVVIVWAKYFRKPARGETTHHFLEGDEDEPESERGHHRRKKKKRLRREHRPRNPTLAETGGLPPQRTGDAPGESK